MLIEIYSIICPTRMQFELSFSDCLTNVSGDGQCTQVFRAPSLHMLRRFLYLTSGLDFQIMKSQRSGRVLCVAN